MFPLNGSCAFGCVPLGRASWFREEIARKMWLCEAKGTVISKKGDDASCFFIIKEGEVEIHEEEKEKHFLKRGEGFGDLALLHNAPQTTTTKGSMDCALWAIDRALFKKIIMETMINTLDETKKFVEGLQFFSIPTYNR